VLSELQRVTAFVRDREDEFIALVDKTHTRIADSDLRSSRVELGKANQRITELDMVIRRLYEDNATDRLSNDRFDNLFAGYEAEQEQLKRRSAELMDIMDREKEKGTSITRFLELVRKYSDVIELTPEITRVFIDKIVVHQAIGRGKSRIQQVDIFFNFIGLIE